MVDICDLELIGSELEQDGLVISLNREYYQQQVVDPTDAKDLLQKCDIANLVGERIVGHAVSLRLANQVSIKRVSGVPFLMIYKFRQG